MTPLNVPVRQVDFDDHLPCCYITPVAVSMSQFDL